MPSAADFRYVVVPHTHWDREWYLPFEQFRLRLGRVVDEVLDVLEGDDSFRAFTLDGQAVILEDYVDVRPEHEPRLRALLAAGRLEVGPSYVLPDELLVGGESLVRNLLLGRAVCRRFGVEPSAAGYLPDSFGHPRQLPQILAGFGVRTMLFSRGLGDELDNAGVVFRWQAPDGSEVTAFQLLPHYDNLALVRDAADAAARAERIVARFGALLERAGCETIVLCNGSDHLPIQPELPRLCADLAERLGTAVTLGGYAEYAQAAAPSNTVLLGLVRGELMGSRLQNVLRGVNSARMYLKQANERGERRLLAAETAAGLAALRGDDAFPAAEFRLAWRDLLRNHPHDSICGCSCDDVHRDMLVRYEQLDRTLAFLEPGYGSALFNPLPYRRTRLVGGAVVELGGFEARAPEPVVANELLRVEPGADGTLVVTDLRDGRRFEGLHVLEDEDDVGDLYTFCPGAGAPWRAAAAEARVLRAGPPVWELELRVDAPCGPIRTVARVAAGSDRVEIVTTVENGRDDHRLRVHFPLAATAEDEVRAEGQFDVVRRPLRPTEPRAPWVEPPDATAHTLGAVALGPLALLTKGLPEYEAGPDGVRLTLLRCVGAISQPAGLATRPTAAGPPVPTPDGQCQGRHVFEYALRFDADRLTDAALVRAAQDYRNDFLGVAAPLDAPLRIDGDVVFSALKGAEDGDGLVLRLFNPNATPEPVVVTTPARLSRLRLDEDDERPLDGALELRPGEIATLRLRL